MKIYTKYLSIFINRRICFLAAIFTVLFMLNETALSQSLAPVNLGTSGEFVILSKTGISTSGTTSITGNIGVSPAAATYITGFGLIMDASGTFATTTLISGKVYASDYTDPTPSKMTTAIGDMETAESDAAGRTSPDFTEIYSGDLTGQTLTPGLYKWGTSVLVSAGGVTISGTANDVWIFQIAQNLDLANGANITLSGGARASNIFWQVSGQATLGTTSVMHGIILCETQIVMNTGATLNGRALAQTAVTLDANSISSSGVTGIKNDLVPTEFSLYQNYPNPFNPSTIIKYSLGEAAHVSLKIYNLLGIEITTLVNNQQGAGVYTTPFSISGMNSDFSSGVYFYRLEAGSFTATRKLIHLK